MLRVCVSRCVVSAAPLCRSVRHAVSVHRRSTVLLPRRAFATREAPVLFGSQGKAAMELFAKTQEKNNSEQVAKELRAFADVYQVDFDLRTAFINPLVTRDLLDDIKAELYPKLNITAPETMEFISTLGERRNLRHLPKIVADYEKLVAHNIKQVLATVTTATPLSADDESKLVSAIKTRIEDDEKLRLEKVVDASVLGGLRVTLEGKSIDLTVASRIKEIDKRIRNIE